MTALSVAIAIIVFLIIFVVCAFIVGRRSDDRDSEYEFYTSLENGHGIELRRGSSK